MSFTTALRVALKARDYKGHYDTLKETHDFARKVRKLDRREARRRHLAYKPDRTLDDTLKALRRRKERCRGALGQRHVHPVPRDWAARMFGEVCEYADRYGAEHRRTLARLEAWRGELYASQARLVGAARELFANQVMIRRDQALHEGMADYAWTVRNAVGDVLRSGLTLVSPHGTSWVSLFEDVERTHGAARSVARTLRRLDRKNRAYLLETRARLKDHNAWVDFARRRRTLTREDIRRNRNAPLPR